MTGGMGAKDAGNCSFSCAQAVASALAVLHRNEPDVVPLSGAFSLF